MEKDADIRDQIPASRVIRAVKNEIILGHNLLRVVRSEVFRIRLVNRQRVDFPKVGNETFRLRPADSRGSVSNLPMQVRRLNDVPINNPDGPDAGARQISCSRTTQASSPDYEDTGGP